MLRSGGMSAYDFCLVLRKSATALLLASPTVVQGLCFETSFFPSFWYVESHKFRHAVERCRVFCLCQYVHIIKSDAMIVRASQLFLLHVRRALRIGDEHRMGLRMRRTAFALQALRRALPRRTSDTRAALPQNRRRLVLRSVPCVLLLLWRRAPAPPWRAAQKQYVRAIIAFLAAVIYWSRCACDEQCRKLQRFCVVSRTLYRF